MHKRLSSKSCAKCLRFYVRTDQFCMFRWWKSFLLMFGQNFCCQLHYVRNFRQQIYVPTLYVWRRYWRVEMWWNVQDMKCADNIRLCKVTFRNWRSLIFDICLIICKMCRQLLASSVTDFAVFASNSFSIFSLLNIFTNTDILSFLRFFSCQLRCIRHQSFDDECSSARANRIFVQLIRKLLFRVKSGFVGRWHFAKHFSSDVASTFCSFDDECERQLMMNSSWNLSGFFWQIKFYVELHVLVE